MFFIIWVYESVLFHDLLHWKENPISKILELKPHQQLAAQEGKKKQI